MNCILVYSIEGTGTTFCEYKFSYNRERPGWEKNFESFSQAGDRQVTESAAVRSVNSGFRPTQDLQYLQCVVLKGGTLL